MKNLFINFLLFFLAGHLSAQQYTFSDLHTISIVANSFASDVNDSGVVVGIFSGQAFKWTNGSMELIPLPSGHSTSSAFGINNNGTICGVAGTPFRLSGSTYSFLNLPTNSFQSPTLGNINSSDNIVGYAEYPEVSATLWQGVEYQNLGILGGITGTYGSYATFINDSGVIVGHSSTNSGEWHAFKYSDGTMQDLGTLPGKTMSSALGIDNRNRIVGWSGWPDRPVFWDSVGVIHELALPQGALSGVATAINDSGDIVGYYYPVGERVACIWKNGVPIDLSTLTTLPTGYQLVDATAINNAGQIVGNAHIPGVIHAFILTPLIIQVTRPASLEVVLTGEQYEIRWDAVGITSLRIEVSIDSGLTYQTIANNVPASANHFTWTFENDILSAKCKIKITDTDDPTKSAKSELFRIKPYVLTRLNPDLNFYEYRKDRDQWGFSNTEAEMWPETWYNQFDYHEGIDPFTNMLYSQIQGDCRFGNSQSFYYTDWISFVNTFTVGSCYFSTVVGLYKPSALLRWGAESRDWRGSCFGIAVANALAFRYKNQFQNKYPNFPSFINPITVVSDTGVKRVVNELFLHQFGNPHKTYLSNIGLKKTPTQTLADLIEMFKEDNAQIRTLGFDNNGEGGGGHEILAYGLEKDSVNTNLFYIKVYDNSNPNSNNRITINTSANGGSGSWVTQDWPGWGGNKWINLMDPTVEYLTNPTMDKVNTEQSPFILDDNELEINNTISASIQIRDNIGNLSGFYNNLILLDIPGSIPLIVYNGSKTPPYGYSLPADNYSVVLNDFAEDTVETFFFTGNKSFVYERSGATQTQTDRLFFDGGVSVTNPDTQIKTVKLLNLINETTQEKLCVARSLELVQNDSVKIENPDSNKVKLISYGSAKEYDIELNYVTENGFGRFGDFDVPLATNTSHTFVPNWTDITNTELMVLVDIGNDGTIDDTLSLINKITGIGDDQGSLLTPNNYDLAQNYPNPFNPTTIINFSVPKTSFVTLKVYDVLGTEVEALVNEEKNSGNYEVNFNASKFSSGIYFYKLQAGSFIETKKMILIK